LQSHLEKKSFTDKIKNFVMRNTASAKSSSDIIEPNNVTKPEVLKSKLRD
jgi:hypothetical protein